MGLATVTRLRWVVERDATTALLATAMVVAIAVSAVAQQATTAPPPLRPPGNAVAQAPTAPPSAADLERLAGAYMRAAVDAYDFSGVVLVARQGAVVFRGAYGYADEAAKTLNTPETRFRIGSVTKPFTAISILLLAERGKLDVSDPMCKFVGPCPDAWSAITIRHLLSHTSGLPNFTGLPGYQSTMATPTTPAQTLDRVRGMPLDFAPGTKYAYSNTGYVALGAIIEKVAGQPYADFLKANVLAPLGMSNTGCEAADTPTPGLAIGYETPDPGSPGPRPPAPVIHMSVPHAAGALYSTVGDLLRFSRAIEKRALLSASSWDAMTTPVIGSYGYGVVVQKQPDGRAVLGHDGGINGFASSFVQMVDPDVTVVILRNSERPLSITRDLLAMAVGGRYSLPAKRVAARVDPAIYDAYVGEYQLAPGFVLTVTREEDRLLAQATGQRQVEVFPESETRVLPGRRRCAADLRKGCRRQGERVGAAPGRARHAGEADQVGQASLYLISTFSITSPSTNASTTSIPDSTSANTV